jgi:hypothetical protein
MSTAAIPTPGTTLKRAGTAIAEVQDISGPSLTAAVVDTTDLSETWASKKPMILDAGDLTLTIHFDPAGATHKAVGGTGLLADFKNKTKQTFQLVFADTATTTWIFSAYVTGFTPAMAVKDKMTAEVVLSITDTPVLS